MEAFEKAVAHCRARKGPALVHGHVIRPYSHSHSDDDKLYRPESERQADALRDPIHNFQMCLLREGILDAEGIERLEKKVDDEVHHAAERALRRAGAVDRRAGDFAAPVLGGFRSDATPSSRPQPEATAGAKTMADLINPCLHDEMRAGRADRRLRRGRGGLHARGVSGAEEGQGQGRSLQADRGPAVRVRFGRACATRRWRRRPLWGARSGWACAG